MITLDEIDIRKVSIIKRKDRFCLPFERDKVLQALCHAYCAEVQQRMPTLEVVNCDTVTLGSIATWITDKKGKSGLLLYGDIGTGKTTALKSLCRVINAACIAEDDKDRLDDHGREVIVIVRAKDIVNAWQNDQDRYKRMLRTELLAIDELGVEAIDVKTYGNSSEPIIDLLSTRYDRQKVTAVSSNLDLKQVSERYGMRMADRFNEMFHKVAYIGPSYRGYANQKKK